MAKRPDEYTFEIWQGGMMVAGCGSTDEAAAKREVAHYAAVYSQDGPVEIRDTTRYPKK